MACRTIASRSSSSSTWLNAGRVIGGSARPTLGAAARLSTFRIPQTLPPPAEPYKTHQPLAKDSPLTHTFFHDETSTWQFIVVDPHSNKAALVDPALDYDPITGNLKTTSAQSLLAFLRSRNYELTRVLETHAHADHLTASQFFKDAHDGAIPVCIGKRITQVQNTFSKRYGIPADQLDSVFDKLWEDREEFTLGSLKGLVLPLPGHTPDHVGYQIGNSVYAGDTIFLPDVGSARADFPGGDPEALFHSAQYLLSLPSDYRIFSGHDYPSDDRAKSCFSTVQDQRERNKHMSNGITVEDFKQMRASRDATLSEPKLLHQSLQINIRAGRLPPADEQGSIFLRSPLKLIQ